MTSKQTQTREGKKVKIKRYARNGNGYKENMLIILFFLGANMPIILYQQDNMRIRLQLNKENTYIIPFHKININILLVPVGIKNK